MKKESLWLAICMSALLLCGVFLFVLNKQNQEETVQTRDKDREFMLGSGIQISETSPLQEEALYKLCKVWGYAKYRHPSVVDGTLNWDAELFRVLPGVLEAKDEAAVNKVLYQWLSQFPFEVPEPDETAKMWLEVHEEVGYETADMDWIADSEFLGSELSSYLKQLSEVYIADREDAYTSFSEIGTVDFSAEKNRSFKMQDDGIKLLGLFRLWNIYEYYSPNVRITRTDWNEVLKNTIPDILVGESYDDYVQTISRAAAATGDAHLILSDQGGGSAVFFRYGYYILPCEFVNIDGQIVVSECSGSSGLKPGDILLELDGTTIAERLAFLKRHMAVPEEDKIVIQLGMCLLRTRKQEAEVLVLRDGEEKRIKAQADKDVYQAQNPLQNGILEGENIGYIDPSALQKGDVEKLMEEFADTDGLIVDLREYPSVAIMYLLGEYLVPEPVQFARMGLANPALPGCFWYVDEIKTGAGVLKSQGDDGNYPYYDKPVVLLMDECSMSQSEFTIMALRQSPNAVVAGNPSIGADGNKAGLTLPGGLTMSISGLGIYTPEGEQTQRVGLSPDVECWPSIEGIRQGRDELLEKGVEIIRESVRR